MSAGIITNAGRDLIALRAAEEEPLTIDRFVLANIPGLDVDQPADPNESIPEIVNIVAERDVTNRGYVNADRVVYSLYLGTDEGDFQFNWVGLLSDDGVLVAVRYINPVTKFATVGAQIGNAMTRNFLVAFTDATEITQITVAADTWQVQFDAASEDSLGLVERATQGEVNTGEDDLRYVSSMKLSKSLINDLETSNPNRGLAAEQGKALKDMLDNQGLQLVQLLNDHTHGAEGIVSGVLDPERLPDATGLIKGAVLAPTADANETGSLQCNQAGIVIKWGIGSVSANTVGNITLTPAFPNTKFGAVVTRVNTGSQGDNFDGGYLHDNIRTAVRVVNFSDEERRFFYIAIGN